MQHKILQLTELIDYDDKKISTRILSENGENKVILFAIKKDQLLDEHVSPTGAFVYVLEGEVEFVLSHTPENKYNLKKGDIFFFNANEMHTVLGKKDAKMVVVRI